MDTNRLLKQTGFSKARNLIIIAAISGIFLIINYSPVFIRNDRVFIYYIKPVLWSLVAFMLLCFPRPRPSGKIRAESYLVWMTILYSIIYILIMMMFGVAVGFGKSPFDHSPSGIFINLIKILPTLTAVELVRDYLINSSDKKTNLWRFAFTVVFITVINLDPKQIFKLKTNLEMVEYIGTVLLPELCGSIFATYLVYLGGPILSIICLGLQEGFYWFSPILPNLDWITQAFISILLPVFGMMFVHFGYERKTATSKKKASETENPFGWIASVTISVLLIWFSIGAFPISPYVILTGSMEPIIYPGDMVLVERNDMDNLEVGDIIQYKIGDVSIFHRIIEIVEVKKETKYKTKGDNNSAPDPELVEIKNIKGRVVYVVPKIGYPVLIFKGLGDAVNKYQF